MRKILVHRYICFFLVCLFSQFIYSQTLATKIDDIIKEQLPHATIGVFVKDAKTGQVIYSKNSDKLLSPTSSMKLFTAAAALYQLKPTYRFLTTFSRKKQDYYISFSGSPSLTETDLTNLLFSLKENNVRIIQGNIVLDTSRFKAPFNQGGVSIDDLGWYYSAPDTATILNGNAPSDVHILASNQSDNLITLITHMLRESDNLYASSLTKELAYSLTNEGTNKQGAFAMKNYFIETYES